MHNMRKTITMIALLACVGFMSAQEAVPSVSPQRGETEVLQLPDDTVTQATEPQTVQTASNPQQPAELRVQPFGFLSYNETMHAMPDYAQAVKSLNELKEAYDKEAQRAEQEFSKKFAEYLDGQKNFPQNIMLKRQKELQLLMEQSVKFKQEAEELLANAEKELMEPVRKALNNAIYLVGKKNGYAYVLNTDANAYPYIDGGVGEDCTDAVLTQMGIK